MLQRQSRTNSVFFGNRFVWTSHSRAKMRFYGLSEQRVRHVINAPKRIEEGIAPKTVAMMQPVFSKGTGAKETWNQEIWVMIQKAPASIKVISAWRYPGKTKPGQPIPAEILREVKSFL
jgi:hypothetical protein